LSGDEGWAGQAVGRQLQASVSTAKCTEENWGGIGNKIGFKAFVNLHL